MSTTKPVVSVCIRAYNIKRYIANAIESVLLQKDIFPIEVLIGDDGSTDGTLDMCMQYQQKYPEVIRVITRDASAIPDVQVMTDKRCVSAEWNLVNLILKSRGEYIAVCDGDDYWIDTSKLYKQITFLKNNPAFGLVTTDIEIIDENDCLAAEPLFHQLNNERYRTGNVFFNLLEGNFVYTSSVCFRRESLDLTNITKDTHWFLFDYWLWLKIAIKTKILCMNDKLVRYRVHSKGISQTPSFCIERNPLAKYDVIVEYFMQPCCATTPAERIILFRQILFLLANRQLSSTQKKTLCRILIRNRPSLYGVLTVCTNEIGKSLRRRITRIFKKD